jgi:hypothetical protein
MAAVASEELVLPVGNSRVLVFGKITLDSTYPAGGEVIDVTGDRDYEYAWDCGSTGSLYAFKYDAANKKLRVLSPTTAQATGMTETSTTDLSAQVINYGAVRPA